MAWVDSLEWFNEIGWLKLKVQLSENVTLNVERCCHKGLLNWSIVEIHRRYNSKGADAVGVIGVPMLIHKEQVKAFPSNPTGISVQ